jgi:hypothetical protein
MLTAQPGLGQSNRYKYDYRVFNLGFMAGLNIADVKTQLGNVGLGQPGQAPILKDINIRPVPGINLGLITNTRLGEHWDFRFVPAVSLQQRNFEYVFHGTQGQDSIVTRKLEASYLDFPAMIKFKSDFYKNYRVYVLTGGKFSVNLVSDKRARDNPELIKINRTDFSLEFGLGVDLYADRVKLSPEIRYSLGLLNIYSPEFTNLAGALQTIRSQSILIAFNFE